MKIIGCSERYSKEQFEDLEKFAQKYKIALKNIPMGCKDSTIVEDCDALFGDFCEEMIEAAKKVKWFQSSWDGVDFFINMEVFSSRKITLTNSANAFNDMIAEYVLGSIINMLHNFQEYKLAQTKHVWRNHIEAVSVKNKRVTILGCGKIGHRFSEIIYPMGANVTGVSRTRHCSTKYIKEILPVSKLEEILVKTDILVMLLPLTKDTENIIDEKMISLLPDNAYIVNAGRGKTLDICALKRALDNDKIKGAVIDVFPNEPLVEDSSIWDTKNLMITPHIAGSGKDKVNMDYVLEIFKDNIKRWSNGEELKNIIDIKKGY